MTDRSAPARTKHDLAVENRCKGVLFMLVGPSGVGKNEVMKGVMAHVAGLRQLATATTRPMRTTEQQGREHLFVSPEVFRQMITQGELLEYQEVYQDHFYGTPRGATQQAFATQSKLIADIEILGAKAVKAAFPANTVTIFIVPPNTETLEVRLRKRGNMSEAEIARRLERAPMELEYADQCDYRVVNSDNALESAVSAVCEIIQKELERRHCVETV